LFKCPWRFSALGETPEANVSWKSGDYANWMVAVDPKVQLQNKKENSRKWMQTLDEEAHKEANKKPTRSSGK